MDSIIAIFKEILKHGKETNNSRTVFFTIMVIILLLNSYLIDNLSIKQFFISNSMKVLINLSEFLFHGYFDVIYFAMLVGIVFYIIWITLSFVISSKVDPYFYNVISFLFRYIKIMWRLSTDCFLIIFLYMMLLSKSIITIMVSWICFIQVVSTKRKYKLVTVALYFNKI